MKTLSLADLAGLIGDSARLQMLTSLLDGNRHSATELALAARVSPQTASSHLSKLKAGGLIVSESRGRQRLYGLRGPEVAAAIESVGALAHPSENSAMPEIRFARTCYDHMAGAMAIALRDQLLRKGILRQDSGNFILTPLGERFLRALQIDAEPLRILRRSFARKCLDWTERHHHIGGALGAALLSRFLETKWMVRVRGARSLRLTHQGEAGFERLLGIRCAAVRAACKAA